MSENSNALKYIEQKQKDVRTNCLNEINESIFQARLENNGRLPHRMVMILLFLPNLTSIG